MKCPKCGYTSFESYDACRKCAADLVDFRQSHGLTPVVFPPALRATLAADLGLAASDTAASSDADTFTFDLPTGSQPVAPQPAAPTDIFSFDDTPAATPAFSFDTQPQAPQQDPFASLLENSAPQPAATAPQQTAQGFEANSFSWDDTPAPATPAAAAPTAPTTTDDDFNSLFGEIDNSGKK